MKNILVFVNPRARQGNQLESDIKNWLKDQGFTVLNANFDPNKDKLLDTIEKYHREKPIVLIGGGDGSVNEALPALVKHQLPLLVIPLGTANNLARSLEIPTDFKKSLELLNQGSIKRIDVGLANGVHFVNVIGIGLSTQVNRLVRSELKRWLGVFAFVLTALKVVWRMNPIRVRIECDGKSHVAYSWQISVCNGRNYGNGLVIHEDATLVDQTLHALSTEVEKWWQGFMLIPSLLTGRFRKHHPVTVLSGKSISIHTPRPMQVDVDGDIKAKTPLKLEVLPEALSIFAP
ncbi:lipid kinase [Bdellovibrio sp. SKB1291214]|uniref:lipid kinase n=1 Tax=Bdellovibrio sp. SKB1291214 TaxID=1732569 RepID=UPI000B517587|nr:lipid kinase [Bdellovibrio sp. SKB1291214]UYL08389.1 lipid kinase [Bdellovibrio sp. SKB1291214]